MSTKQRKSFQEQKKQERSFVFQVPIIIIIIMKFGQRKEIPSPHLSIKGPAEKIARRLEKLGDLAPDVQNPPQVLGRTTIAYRAFHYTWPGSSAIVGSFHCYIRASAQVRRTEDVGQFAGKISLEYNDVRLISNNTSGEKRVPFSLNLRLGVEKCKKVDMMTGRMTPTPKYRESSRAHLFSQFKM